MDVTIRSLTLGLGALLWTVASTPGWTAPPVATQNSGFSPGDLGTTIATAPERWFIIYAGTLLADAGKPARHNVTIIVHGKLIDSIRDGRVEAAALTGVDPALTTVVDLSDKYVMAGLIDAHVHLAVRPPFAAIYKKTRDKLLGGATTVRDVGGRPELIFPLREAINAGYVVGPRVLAAGAPITATGGHGDVFRNGDFYASQKDPAFTWGVCDGAAECEKVARRQVQLGADLIKVIATAGVVDDSDTGIEQQFTDEELRAIVTAAHLMKRKVAAHAIGVDGIKAALRAGVDSIEHGNYLDEEGARMMKERGTYLVATLEAPNDVLQRVQGMKATAPGEDPLSDNTKKKVMALPEARPGGLGRQIRMASRFGVKLGAGTDFGGTIGDELVLMVEHGGITPLQALQAATLGNADLLGVSQLTGTIEAGKSADIVAFDGDPSRNIRDSNKVVFVMSQGHEAKGPGFRLP